MRRYFLWRENYVDFLWATNVTAQSYFFDSGLLIYEDGVLSAFATKKEFDHINKKEFSKINSLTKLQKMESDFIALKKEVAEFVKKNNRNIGNLSDKELYDVFIKLFQYFSQFVKKYRYLEPHIIKNWEDGAIDIIKQVIPDKNPELVLSDILSSGGNLQEKLQELHLIKQRDIFVILDKIAKIRFQAKTTDESLASFSEEILIETAKRTLIAVSQISHMGRDELHKALVNRADIDLYKINMRAHGFGLEIKNGTFSILSQNRYKQIIKQERAKSRVDVLKGTTAYPGKVVGTARVTPLLSTPDEYREYIQSLTDEDIVVAAMTSPELTASFKKVCGVITDEGGLMSHAALISRETKTPCVIGTKYATRFLKEGEKILLDADSGIVTKI